MTERNIDWEALAEAYRQAPGDEERMGAYWAIVEAFATDPDRDPDDDPEDGADDFLRQNRLVGDPRS